MVSYGVMVFWLQSLTIKFNPTILLLGLGVVFCPWSYFGEGGLGVNLVNTEQKIIFIV